MTILTADNTTDGLEWAVWGITRCIYSSVKSEAFKLSAKKSKIEVRPHSPVSGIAFKSECTIFGVI